MKAFITGVTGFVGSHLAEHLLARGDQVLGCSRRGKWPPDVPEHVARQIELFSWDLPAGIPAEVHDRVASFAPESIYHLAALSIPSDCGEAEPTAAAIWANVDGTRRLVELVASLPTRPRFLLASSCYVYGPVSFEQPVVDEQSPISPLRGYGKTKWAAEQLFQQAVADNLVEGVVARAFQHSGPRQSPRMILPDWARQFTRSSTEPIRVICLDAFLDLTDVRDIARAYRALVVKAETGSVYNVGSGVSLRSGDLLEQMRQLYDPSRPVVELSPGRRQQPIAEISRLRSCTSWTPQIPIQQTINDILEYWLQRSSG